MGPAHLSPAREKHDALQARKAWRAMARRRCLARRVLRKHIHRGLRHVGILVREQQAHVLHHVEFVSVKVAHSVRARYDKVEGRDQSGMRTAVLLCDAYTAAPEGTRGRKAHLVRVINLLLAAVPQ